jgi:hypothetical protein
MEEATQVNPVKILFTPVHRNMTRYANTVQSSYRLLTKCHRIDRYETGEAMFVECGKHFKIYPQISPIFEPPSLDGQTLTKPRGGATGGNGH